MNKPADNILIHTPTGQKSVFFDIPLSVKSLKITALITLSAPTLIFLFTFLRWYIGIPFCGCLLTAMLLYVKKQRQIKSSSTIFGERDDHFTVSLPSLICCIMVAVLWAYLSGIGGRFTQSNDFHGRNAIFHDLINYSWPVYFENGQGALTYYIGFWLVPALAGKLFGVFFGPIYAWKFANLFLLLQTVWYLLLIFLLMLSLLNRRSHVFLFLLLAVLFSGMDGLMSFLKNDWSTHLEYWASDWQYSSLTTCLFWVFNQTLPAWLATLLLMNSITEFGSYGLFGASLVLTSPFPLVGFFLICAGSFIAQFISRKESGQRLGMIKDTLNSCNILAVFAVIPIFFYLKASNAMSGSSLHIDLFSHKYTFPQLILAHLLFALIEWGLYAVLMFTRFKKDPVFLTVCFSLIAFPWFRSGGYFNDFPMRASIPALFALMLYCAESFSGWKKNPHMALTFLLAACLAIGIFTPMTEFKRGIDEYVENGYHPVIRDYYKTIIHEEAQTENYVCTDIENSLFFTYLAKPLADNEEQK